MSLPTDQELGLANEDQEVDLTDEDHELGLTDEDHELGLTDEDQEADRQPPVTIRRLSRRTKGSERANPPPESIVRSAQGLNPSRSRAPKTGIDLDRLLTPKEASEFLGLSLSWLAKARMRGDGPPYVKPCRSIRYRVGDLVQWLK